MMKTNSVMTQQVAQPVSWPLEGVQIVLGALYIALLAQVEIPLKPVPMTLQTFAIFSLALFQGSRKSCFSVLLYLVAATLGLPVLAGACSRPLWILGYNAGYCLSFPLAAYVAGKFAESKNSVMWMALGLGCAQIIILLMGVTWLSFMIGWQQALIFGFYPFIVVDAMKIAAALSMKMAAKSIVGFYQKMKE
jgi:biotin transport system substrate-specific component